MWESLFQLVPEKRLPFLLQAFTFLTILLPIAAALSATVAWKLHDHLGKGAPAPSPAVAAVAPPTSVENSTDLQAALRATQAALQRTEAALQQAREDLKASELRTQNAVAHAADRKITPAQRQRFLVASKLRPKGPVGITIIADNPESENYGTLIRKLLVQAGYDVSPEFSTITLHNESLVGLRVGAFSKETAPPHALPLAASLIDSDIPAFPVVDRRVPEGRVEITVGTNPAGAPEDFLPPSPSSSTPPPASTTSTRKGSKAKGSKTAAASPAPSEAELPFPPAKLSLEITPE